MIWYTILCCLLAQLFILYYQMLIDTLQTLWLNENQSKVWFSTRQYGPSPASSLGGICGLERSHTYKILQQLIEMMLVSSTIRGKTTYYYVSDKSVLHSFHQRKIAELEQQKTSIALIETELEQLSPQSNNLIPPIRLWTWNNGVSQGLDDIVAYCLQQWLQEITILWSHTFESWETSTQLLGERRNNFFTQIKQHNIFVEWYETTGTLFLEKILVNMSMSDVKQFPTGYRAIQVILAGEHLYYLLYRREPIMLKISSEEIVNLMRILLENKK